jgi:hypothetical protein
MTVCHREAGPLIRDGWEVAGHRIELLPDGRHRPVIDLVKGGSAASVPCSRPGGWSQHDVAAYCVQACLRHLHTAADLRDGLW